MKAFTFQAPANILFEAGASKTGGAGLRDTARSVSCWSPTRAYVTQV